MMLATVTETKKLNEAIGAGLRIRAVTGQEFEVRGPVTFKDFSGDGRVYYCSGNSYPEEIVAEVV